MSNALKKCQTCEIEKSVKHFYKSSRKTGGYQHECKQCMNERAKEKNRLREDEFFDTNWQRKIWKQYFGDGNISSPNHFGPTKNDTIRFIPRKKTQRI